MILFGLVVKSFYFNFFPLFTELSFAFRLIF